MEAVEYLMIGEEADSLLVVGKSGMQRMAHICKRNLILYNLPQTLLLLGTVSQDEELVAFQHIVFECLFQQLDILVEQRLRGDVELYGRLGCTRRILPNLNAAEPGSILDETGSGAQLCFTLHVTHDLLTVHLSGTTEAFL